MDDLLKVTRVPRSLELKTKLFGFEIGDVLLVFAYMAAMNLVLGDLRFRSPFIWGSSVAFASALYFLKLGKPDNYIPHLVEYIVSPNVSSASGPDINFKLFKPIGASSGKN